MNHSVDTEMPEAVVMQALEDGLWELLLKEGPPDLHDEVCDCATLYGHVLDIGWDEAYDLDFIGVYGRSS
jgi:hypothetical protein